MHTNTRSALLIGLTAGILGAATSFGMHALADGDPPTTVPWRGVLEWDGERVDGAVEMRFSLYDAPSDGQRLWAETWTGEDAVDVRDGRLEVALGTLDADHGSLDEAI